MNIYISFPVLFLGVVSEVETPYLIDNWQAPYVLKNWGFRYQLTKVWFFHNALVLKAKIDLMNGKSETTERSPSIYFF